MSLPKHRVMAAQYSISPLCSLTTWMPAHKGWMRCWRYERKGGGWGDKGRKQHMSVLKGILNVDDPLRCFIDSKSSCHGQPAEHGQHRQRCTQHIAHSTAGFPFGMHKWNESSGGQQQPWEEEELESESPAQHTLLHSANNATANQFRFSAASWPTWPTVLLAPRKPSSCLYDLCTADREDLLPEHTAARLQIAASRCKTCVSDEALSPATGDFINQTSSWILSHCAALTIMSCASDRRHSPSISASAPDWATNKRIYLWPLRCHMDPRDLFNLLNL